MKMPVANMVAIKVPHEDAADQAEDAFNAALQHLRFAAAIMRGPSIDASPQAMQTELALTKAIDALSGNGFKAPKMK